MKAAQLLASGLLFTCISASAWDVSGHMVVAQIAYHELNPHAAARLNHLAAAPVLKYKGHFFNAVNVAAWADDVKHASVKDTPFAGHFGKWHFIDLGCDPGNPDLIAHPPKLTTANGDVVTALNHCVSAIQTKKYDALVPSEAVALALIVHLVGDIHQPLHCASHYYSPAFKATHPKSQHDGGGNADAIANFADKYPELHQLWDTAYKLSLDPVSHKVVAKGDLSTFSVTPDSKPVKTIADDILAHTQAPATLPKHDFAKWASETHAVGCKIAYGHLHADVEAGPTKVTDEYVREAKATAYQQLSLAGHRLAALLNELYP